MNLEYQNIPTEKLLYMLFDSTCETERLWKYLTQNLQKFRKTQLHLHRHIKPDRMKNSSDYDAIY
jgi:hypothetical protein